MIIIIYTGPIEQGKSTALFDWAQARQDTAGVFCLWKESRKQLLLWPDGEWVPFQADKPDKRSGNIIEVGRYWLYQKAFPMADDHLKKVAQQTHRHLVVDEAGKLELQGQGLHPTIQWLLHSNETSFENLILVVRDTLVAAMKEHYQIPRARVVSSPLAIDI